MIVEHAILNVKPGQIGAFEAAMVLAEPLIACQPGFNGIEVRQAVEKTETYLLVVYWDNIASHRDGFRKSPEYSKWRELLHKFYEPMPSVDYFGSSIL